MPLLLSFFLLFLSAFTFHDGDTISRISYRLAYIDAPELKQTCRMQGKEMPIGQLSRNHLKQLSKGNITECLLINIDRYGRAIAKCPFNLMMVRDGMAVCYDRYMNEEEKAACHKAEEEAKKHRLGIWQCEDFVMPEEYRRRQRE